MRTYMVKYKENGVHSFQMFVDLNTAKKFMEQKNGMIYIADGKYTKSLDGVEVNPFTDQSL